MITKAISYQKRQEQQEATCIMFMCFVYRYNQVSTIKQSGSTNVNARQKNETT